MKSVNQSRQGRIRRAAWLLVLLAVALACVAPAFAGKDKKKKEQPAEKPKKSFLEVIDYSKLVWPQPPAIARVTYLNWFSGEKLDSKPKEKKKSSWKERLAGIAGEQPAAEKPRFQLIMPYGLAVDSKGRVYIADRKVKAIFIVTPETGEFEMIKHGADARFTTIIGLAMDDSDRLFVSDSGARRVLMFSPQRKLEGHISEGMVDPGGLAIDIENRFLYVADAGLNQVLVYDADPPHRLLRKVGLGGKDFTRVDPAIFAKPTNVAVDADGNLYVSDTLNNRVQIFDADGNFLSMFGKAGDGPGYLARPKGIAVDVDGHIWVADAVQDRVQVFDREGRLLAWIGGHGLYPGQFRTLVGIAIDKNNRVFTTEQYPGRMQAFRYVTEQEAKAEKEGPAAAGKNKTAAAPPNSATSLPQKPEAQ